MQKRQFWESYSISDMASACIRTILSSVSAKGSFSMDARSKFIMISLDRIKNDIFWLMDQKLGHFTDWSNCHLKLCTGETCKTKIVIQRHSANNRSMFTDFLFHHRRSFLGQLIQAEPDGLADARA